MIKDYSQVKSIDIGEIEIMKNFSFFEADGNYTNEILSGFNKQVVKGREINVEVAERKKSDRRAKSFSGGDRKKKRFDRTERSNKPFRRKRKN
jgi:hypothetical protein